MRVTLLTHYYPPEVGAPQARLSALARGLSRRGVEVTVHTGFPHYPDGVIQPPYRNRPWLTEDENGVRVVRSAVYPAPNRGFGRRIANHVSFAFSALATAPAAGPADAVIVETPPLLLAGCLDRLLEGQGGGAGRERLRYVARLRGGAGDACAGPGW